MGLQTRMLPYVRPDVYIFDVQKATDLHGIDIMNFYRSTKTTLHEIFFFTQKPKRIQLGDAWGTNPYHLFFYMLARFYFVDNGSTDIIFYYPKDTTNTQLFTEGAFASLPSRFKRETVKDDAYEYVELPGCNWHHDYIDEPWIYDYMRDLYKDIWSSTKQEKGKYSYILRDPAYTTWRRVLNQTELAHVLKKEGFSLYTMENLTFVDQIRLFRSSEFIVTAHASSLVHLVFCEPGTTILEIYPNIPGKNHFYDLARKMGHRYNRFTALDSFDEKTEDLTVTLPVFRDVIIHLKKTMNTN